MIKHFVHQKLDNWQSCNIKQLKKYVAQIDYVSFDIFDTILKREVPKPVDVFSIVEEISGETGFKEKRIEREKTARNKTNNKEVTFDNQYDNLLL